MHRCHCACKTGVEKVVSRYAMPRNLPAGNVRYHVANVNGRGYSFSVGTKLLWVRVGTPVDVLPRIVCKQQLGLVQCGDGFLVCTMSIGRQNKSCSQCPFVEMCIKHVPWYGVSQLGAFSHAVRRANARAVCCGRSVTTSCWSLYVGRGDLYVGRP